MKKRLLSLVLIFGLILPMGALDVFSSDKPLVSYYFEEDSEGWLYWNSISGAKHTYPVSDAFSEGSKGLLIKDTTKTEAVGMQSPLFDAQEGKVYTLLASCFVIKNKMTMYLRFYDSSNKQLSSESSTFTQSKWEERAISYTAPTGTKKARLIICTNSTDIAGAYVDNIRVYEGSKTASLSISGTVPEILPTIEENDNYEILDDGYEDGERIYFQSFEDGIAEWEPYYYKSSYSVDEKNATHGNKSLHINDTSDTISGGAKSGKLPIAQGNTYMVSLDGFIAKAGVALHLRFYDSAGNVISQPFLNFPAAGWNYKSISAKAPEDAVSLDLLLVSGSTTLAEAYFDNIRVFKGYKTVRPEETVYSPPTQSTPVNSSIIAPVNNKLQYNTYNDKGDTLSDFSHAGFYEGEINLPETELLSLSATLSPSGTGDDTALIQSAIDNAAASYDKSGMQVVKLKAGTYYINETGLKLKSGVVLSGEGQSPNGTILHSTSVTTGNVIEADGGAVKRLGNTINITDSYVKSGSKSITVSDASTLNVGDLIYIVHPSTLEWIKALKMNNINTVYGDSLSWKVNELDNKTSRVITKIEGNVISFDYGLFIPYDKTYAQSYIYKADTSALIHDVGVENLRVTSRFSGDPYDNNHSKMAIYVKRTKNMFVRNVTAKNMYNGVFGCRADSSNITVQNCSSLDPVSTIEGGNRYPFYADLDTERILFTGCYSYDGRHDYMAVKGTSGPIVFSDSISDMSNACSETHASFATGVLFENLYQVTERSNGFIGFPNRGYYGDQTPQGWTAAGCVAWNCLSHSIIVNKPLLTYNNFTVGVWGVYNTETSAQIKKAQSDSYQYTAYRYSGVDVGPDSAFLTKDGTPMIGDGYKEAEFTPVNPRSLFKAQLSERFTGTITNGKPNAPIIIYPRPDKEVSKSENQVSVNGIYEKGASKVYVYIDDTKHEASLNTSKYEFNTTVALSEGVHKIYATQVIDGVEGNKSADRFIIVGNKGSLNPQYLQSNYSANTLSLITNDERLTYNEYIDLLQYPDISEFEGEGTDKLPYIIDSLVKFKAVFSNGDRAYPKDKVYLLSGFDKTPLKLPSDFKPLGVAFTGKLIGGDMVNGEIEEKIQIINFNITTGKATENVDYITSINSNKVQGIIFHKLDGATVKNLKFEGSVNTPNTPAFFGTLAGHVLGSTIENVHNYASIDGEQTKGIGGIIGWSGSNSVINNCSNHGNITIPYMDYSSPDAGGIIGNMTATVITNTYNYGNIQGRDNAGGIAGYSNCNITKCGNFGDISVSRSTSYGYAGGISGRTNGGSISECFNVGKITSVKYAGGLFGHVNSGKTSNVTSSFNLGYVSGEVSGGLAIGINSGTSHISGFYDIGNLNLKILAGTNSGSLTHEDAYGFSTAEGEAGENEVRTVSLEFIKKLVTQGGMFTADNGWTITDNYPYPNLKNNPFNPKSCKLLGEGTEENPYRIYVKENLDAVNENPSAVFMQMSDIFDVSEMLCDDTVFSGVYDGNGFDITIEIDDSKNNVTPKYVGLFKKASGTIRNLNIRGSVNAGNINWQGGAAAFVGKAEDGLSITDCKNYASVVSEGHQTAGIVGSNASGTITVMSCINYGDITADIKASGIIGVIAASSTVQKCGNYGNITGGTHASGISSWVYTWKWLENNFNVGTIKAVAEGGIASGLYGDIVVSLNAKNIQKSFNGGNLYGDVTCGIGYILSGGSNLVNIKHSYNAVYADYPILNETEDCVPVFESIYWLGDGESGISKDALKNISLNGFVLYGDYLYPQIALNKLDEDKDSIDFYYVTVNNSADKASVANINYKADKFYAAKGGKLSLKITPEDSFYTSDLYIDGAAVDTDISTEKIYELEINKDINITISDKELPKRIIPSVSEDGKIFSINLSGIKNGKTVILALYNGERLVEVHKSVYEGEFIPFTATKAYTKAKVMVWEDLNSLIPVCGAETIK